MGYAITTGNGADVEYVASTEELAHTLRRYGWTNAEVTAMLRDVELRGYFADTAKHDAAVRIHPTAALPVWQSDGYVNAHCVHCGHRIGYAFFRAYRNAQTGNVDYVHADKRGGPLAHNDTSRDVCPAF